MKMENLCHYCQEFSSLDWSAVGRGIRLGHHLSFAALQESSKNGCKLCVFLCQNLLRCVATYPGDKPTGVSWKEDEAEKWLLAEDEIGKGFIFETGGDATDDVLREEADLVDGVSYIRESWGIGRACNIRVATPKGSPLSSISWMIQEQPRADLKLAKSWFRQCQDNHKRCAAPLATHGAYPTRILHITSDASGLITVKLRESKNTKGPYFALSHCWGSFKPVITTSANYEDHRKGIQLQDLPSSFQDAVSVTRSFGFEFLWIDSLCIVQDSREDWERECPLMANIYSNATVTIAASDAQNSSQGFLHDYPPADADVVVLDGYAGPGCHGITAPITLKCATETPWAYFTIASDWHTNLSSRGWALQERLLSNRILSFCTRRVLWECQQVCHADDRHHPFTLDPLFSETARVKRVEFINTENKIFEHWREVAQTFADCSLTYISDRLPALSGLASRFSLQLNDSYAAGIWRRDIHAGLSWNVVHHDNFNPNFPLLQCSYLESAKREYLKTIPSWSWLSTGCRLSFESRFSEPGRMQSDIHVSSIETDLSGTNPFGNVSGGLLKVNGQMKNCILGADSQNQNQYEDVYDQELTVKVATLVADCWRIQDLRGVNREHRRNITALFLARCDAHGDDISLRLALALQPVYDTSGAAGRTYRRVGLIIWSSNMDDCEAGKTWFERGIHGGLTIV
ncbi:heterokaryon incompatibility protein-domain-containing protein [Daldinia decipiens]|uniref:heterokaryon incompatibility protein-domain-containing protein n=1 Tax=Daldinia decipiens TaxID=326647 RepID=UPI0020C2080A|nr:heterokaryon incompatibility protein-domain-containing protein [Daldinia decipiens]KAI1658775.1 heterokaryon incompatibility protein-domain-containing protein [Daldinia decipiens]